MLGLAELKQTKVYQEAKEEGKQQGLAKGQLKAKLEAIPRMIEFGLREEEIALLQGLPLEVVQQTTRLFYEQTVAALIDVLNNQHQLFSPQDLSQLAELIAPLPDRIEDLSRAISRWCKQQERSAVIEAIDQVLQCRLRDTVEKLLEIDGDAVAIPEYPLNKLILQNAIG